LSNFLFYAFYFITHSRDGDWGTLTQLFFDNLSTLLGALFAIQNMSNFGVDPDQINQIVWGKIVPGVGLTLIIGNLYYSWQSIRMTNKHGRPYTAQPYGINTPAAFAFVFNIMCMYFFNAIKSSFHYAQHHPQ
jgi:AGZA family xanthine/uracil permease-like MFS transporter